MSQPESREVPREAGRALHVALPLLDGIVAGAYLFGSAVAGGLRPDSDVDVLVIVNEGLSDETRKRLVEALMGVSGRVGDATTRPIELTIIRLSDVVPWRYPPRTEFIYGEWLRDAFEKGWIPEPAHDPDLTIVLKAMRDHSISLSGPEASEILDPVPLTDIHRAIRESLPGLIEGVRGDERNVVLTLARMWLTAAVGEIAGKDVAAEWAIRRLPEPHASLLDMARRAYRGECADTWAGREAELMALVAHMRRAIESGR